MQHHLLQRGAPRSHTARVVCLVACALLASACALPVTVKRADPEVVQRQLTGYVLTTGQLSLATENTLRRFLLTERFADSPERALAELHTAAIRDDNPEALFALAELSFYHAKASGQRPYYLAAAVYAFAFLFPGEAGTPPNALDPRLRVPATSTTVASRKGSWQTTAQRSRCRRGSSRHPRTVAEVRRILLLHAEEACTQVGVACLQQPRDNDEHTRADTHARSQ